MMVLRRSAIFVTFLALSACDGRKAGTSPELDSESRGDGVSDTVPEVAALVDLFELRSELPPETKHLDLEDEECTGHYDCFDGWFVCEDGEMIAAFAGSIPCWIWITCEEAGNSWPCLSGECGPYELCMDDIDNLESLVPEEIEWRSGVLELTSSSDNSYGNWSCLGSVCTWSIMDGEESVLEFRLLGLASLETTHVEGTTHLVSLEVPGTGVKDLSVQGHPIEIDQAVFIWAPLHEFTVDDNGGDPKMGYSGALTFDSSDGVRTVIVWLREHSYSTPVRFAIHTIDLTGVCASPRPFLLDGACVECLSGEDCTDGLACNPENHRCEPLDGACEYCENPYPACTEINGVWSCVQCMYDEDCPEGVECEPDLFSCNSGGEVFCNGCTSDDDCQSLQSDLQLECDVASGCCQDVRGLCDGVEGFCSNGECKGLWEDYLGCGVWPTSQNEVCETIDPWLGLCTCSAPVDIEDPASCPPPDLCAGGACPPEAVCVDAPVVELMFGASAPFDAGVCLPLDWIVNEL